MNQPSKLNKLIAELSPYGVEFRKIKDCFILRRGDSITKETSTEGNIPVIAGGQSPAYFIDKANRMGDTIVVSSSGAYAGYVSYWNTPIFVSDAFSIEADKSISLKFLYYFLKNRQESIHSLKKGGGVPHVHVSDLAPMIFPFPPLPVQEEIVRILDTFSGMVAELEAEQAARVRQYEHYRNELLINHGMFTIATDRDEMREYSLNEVCLPVSNIRWNENGGKTFRYIDLTSTEIATKSIQDTLTITSEDAPSRAQQIVRVNDVIFGSTRPTLKRYAFITNEFDGEICSTGFCVLRSDPKKILPKYLYFHISSTAFEDHVEKYQRGSAYPAISDKDLKSFKIPVPPLDVQEQIVSILDRFDALVNDLKSGLPAEIALRRKQYEYYRDKLLTFEPKQPPL